ncbi:hypothetical protein INR49_000836, partial [Caranx melampygus]
MRIQHSQRSEVLYIVIQSAEAAATSVLDFAQKTEPGTLHLLLQKLLSTIEPQELQCLLQTRLNNMAKKMVVKQQLSSSSSYHKLLSTIEPQELQCLLQTTLNNVNWKQWSVSCACLDGEEDGGQ